MVSPRYVFVKVRWAVSIESSTQNPSPLSVLFCIWHNRKRSCTSLHHWVYSNAQPGCVVCDRRNFVRFCDVLWTKLLLHMAHNISVTFHLLSTLSFISFHLKCVIISTVFLLNPDFILGMKWWPNTECINITVSQ